MSGFLHQDRVRVPRAPGRVEGWVIVGLVVAALVWSGISPLERGTWFLEIAWILIGLTLVLVTWRRPSTCPATRTTAWVVSRRASCLRS